MEGLRTAGGSTRSSIGNGAHTRNTTRPNEISEILRALDDLFWRFLDDP
jgi:hypothetical protein